MARWTANVGRPLRHLSLLFIFIASFAAISQEKTPDLVASAPDAAVVLKRLESALRPPRPEELMSLANELQARGQEKAARAVLSGMTSTKDDLSRLVRRCLFLGQVAAADSLLVEMSRRFPRDIETRMLRAATYQAAGESELAMRELLNLRGETAGDQRALVDLQLELLKMSLQGGGKDVGDNPWKVRWVGTSGAFQPGAIDPREAGKIPPLAFKSLAELLTLLPRQGYLWALLGELFSAAGDPKSALACLQRAEALLYAPPLVREHRRLLEEEQRSARLAAERQLAPPPTAASSTTGSEYSTLASRPVVLLILSLGVVFIVVVATLQLREWLKPRR